MENGKELDWNDKIENDGSEYMLLQAGDYDFEITDFERARHGGSEKLPPCNKAVLSVKITAPDGQSTTIKHNLFLHSNCEGILSAFFRSIGQKKKGEPLHMNWNAVIGARGRCKVGIHNWKNTNGDDMQSNQIKRFYEPVEGQQTGPQWKAGNF